MNEISTQPQQPAPRLSVEQQRAILMHRVAAGAKWWYWIAALTLVNALAAAMHIGWGFAIGTGITDILSALAHERPGVRLFAIAANAVIIGLIALWGVLCSKGYRWAFWTGIVLYAIDLLVELLLRQWIGAAFHAYAIYCIGRGAAAAGLLVKLNRAVAAQQLRREQDERRSAWLDARSDVAGTEADPDQSLPAP